MDTLIYVRERISNPELNLSEVAEAAGVGYSWLKMFARGEIPDPGYSRVKALAEYFRGAKERAA